MKKLIRVMGIGLILTSVMVVALGGSMSAQEGHGGGGERPEIEKESPIVLNPSEGSEIGAVYEAYLSPQQEGGEEEDTPGFIPASFRSTAPSVPRNERTSRGHGVVEFTNDLSKAYVYLAVENINLEDVVMLHLHCGRPGQLGPIIVDFSIIGDIHSYLEDGVMRAEVTNEDIVAAASHGLNPIDAFTSGCPIVPSIPNEKVKTVAGMALIAAQGELYFNLHTKGQTYFGDIRGQLSAVTVSSNP